MFSIQLFGKISTSKLKATNNRKYREAKKAKTKKEH